MSAPVAGYVFDGNASSIRAVVGVPGAASAGDRVSLNDSLTVAFLHPSLQLAAGIGKDGSVITANWRDPAHPQQTAIAPRFGKPDRIVFAASADRALLMNADGVELWSGLSTGSSASAYGYSSVELGGVPRTAALSTDGALAAVVLDTAQVVEVSETGIRTVGEGRAAVYSQYTSDLFILSADGSLSRVGGDGASLLASGLAPDAELASVTGFNGVVAMSGKKGTVSLIDASSGQLTRVDCGGCSPGRAQTLSTPGILYFENTGHGGLLLDMSSSGSPRIVPLAGIDAWSNQ